MNLRGLLVNREEGRPRAAVRLGLHLILLGILVFLFQLAALLLVVVTSVGVEGTPGMLIQSAVLLPAITLSVFLARRFIDRRSMAGLGLQREGAARDLLFGFGMAGGMLALIYLAELALGWLRFVGYGPQAGGAASWPLDILAWLLVFFIVGWYEELLSRGYWLVNLSEGLNRILAALITSAAFGALHLSNPAASWASTAGLFFSGLWFTYAALASGGLWLPIGAHIGWNIFEGVIFGFPVSGLTTATLVRQAPLGPVLWTGGAFGPEAGLVVLPALALGAVAVWAYTRRR